MEKEYRALIRRLMRAAKRHYGRNLVSLVVFGSIARDQARPDSDLDVLIICDRLPRGRMRRAEEFGAEIEAKLEPFLETLRKKGFSTCLMPVFKTVEEARRKSPLFLDMVHDALIVCDRNGFFEGILHGMRRRLKELNARRVYRGRQWYWILKPDYKFGEVISL
ncbi:MAG: nucleotidyltransferase domain-containing protein [Elusimicrobia bacterium]|nr:nucleotidyltransferase domain-containing protein [Elusimicrobiota bacterium]